MRDRALNEGFSSFADHELLEYLLFHTVPRVDTNPTAHALLQEFGSIKAILEASDDELCRVSGVGEKSALMFSLMIEFLRRYEAEFYRKQPTYCAMSDVVQYLHPKFYGINVERLYLMMFNNRMNLIDCVMLSEGNVNCTEASIRKITELVLNKRVSSVLLAHNHPDGLAVPSSEDIHLTDVLNSHLGMLGIVLVEHIIFAGMNYQPIMKQRSGTFRCSPLSRRMECEFYEKFYDRKENESYFEPLFYRPTEEDLKDFS